MPLKNKKCAKGIPLNCGKGLQPRVEHGVTCTSICLVLRSFTVENQLAELLFLHNASLLCSFIHSFILETYIAPLQETTTQRRDWNWCSHARGATTHML